jgi:hypothetical protein
MVKVKSRLQTEMVVKTIVVRKSVARKGLSVQVRLGVFNFFIKTKKNLRYGVVGIPDRFYRGVVHSPKDKKHPNFRYLLVDTVYEKQDEHGNWYTESLECYDDYLIHSLDKEDIFYGVYASYYIDNVRSGLKITETSSLSEAINIAEQIMGSKIIPIPPPEQLRK